MTKQTEREAYHAGYQAGYEVGKKDAAKHGYWIFERESGMFKCSECGGRMVRNVFDYCPWCPAKMDGKESGDDL